MDDENPAFGFFNDHYFLLSNIVIDLLSLQIVFDIRLVSPSVKPFLITETLCPQKNIIIIWDKVHTSVKSFKINDYRNEYFSVTLLGETNIPDVPQFIEEPCITWYDDEGTRINQITHISPQGRYEFNSMSLDCIEQDWDTYDFQTDINQNVAVNEKFVVCLQPTFLASFYRVIFAVRYQHLNHLQICIVDSVRDNWSDKWVPELQFINIPKVNHFFGVFAGPGGQMLVRVSESESEKEEMLIYDCPEPSLHGLRELTCIGKINLDEIPNFCSLYPITYKCDNGGYLVSSSYFLSSHLEFSNETFEDLNVVRCQRVLEKTGDLRENDINQFKYDVLSFPPSRYLSPQEMINQWRPILMKNLSYLSQAQIPKSFCILKGKKEDDGYKYKIQIMTLPNCMK